MADKTTAFHGTSTAVVKKARSDNRIRGWFDTEKSTCYEYAYGKSSRDGSKPAIVEVVVPTKKFGSSWLAMMQVRLGKSAYTSVLSLSWKRYVVAVWTWSPSKKRYIRRAEKK